MDHLRRPPKSAAEVTALPPLGTTQCSAHVRERGQTFSPETLVYLIREATLRRDTALVELSARLLVGQRGRGDHWEGGHCESTIVKLARSFGFWRDLELRKAFRSGCLEKLVEAIHAGREEKHYWEERFGAAFKMACIDVARSLRLPRNRDMEAAVANETADEIDIDDVDLGAELIDTAILERLAAPHHVAALLKATRALPKRQGHAVLLAWVEGRAIEGDASDTVSAIMGITPRAVYKLLEKARSTLSADPDLRAIWFGEI